MTTLGVKRNIDLKVIILGDYAVGKTALICRYIDGTFQRKESTIGAAFFFKQWGQRNIAVWDTAGHERYTGLSSFYCRNAGAAILAFDLSSVSSYESLWARFLPLLKAADSNCLKIVVGTKVDILKDDSREVSREEAKQFAREINREMDPTKLTRDPYFETSSLTGYNVKEVFQFMFELCLPLSDEQEQIGKHGNTVDLTASGTPQRNKRCC